MAFIACLHLMCTYLSSFVSCPLSLPTFSPHLPTPILILNNLQFPEHSLFAGCIIVTSGVDVGGGIVGFTLETKMGKSLGETTRKFSLSTLVL